MNFKLKIDQKMSILKTWKKFRKPGENFQKFFGHSVYLKMYIKISKT